MGLEPLLLAFQRVSFFMWFSSGRTLFP